MFGECGQATPLNLSIRVWLERHVGWAINRIQLYTIATSKDGKYTAKSFILESVVRGHHIYKRIWTPVSMKARGNVLNDRHVRTYINFMFVRTRVDLALSMYYNSIHYVSLFLRIN